MVNSKGFPLSLELSNLLPFVRVPERVFAKLIYEMTMTVNLQNQMADFSGTSTVLQMNLFTISSILVKIAMDQYSKLTDHFESINIRGILKSPYIKAAYFYKQEIVMSSLNVFSFICLFVLRFFSLVNSYVMLSRSVAH